MYIGEIYSGAGSVTSVETATHTEILSVEIPKGTYIILRGCDFDTNANGIRRVGSTSTSARDAFVSLSAVPTGDTVVQHMELAYYNSPTTIKCYAYQTSGSALNIWPYMKAIKIA